MEAAARRAEALARHCHAPLAARGPRAPRDPRAATPTRSGGVDRRAASGGGAAGGSDSESSSDDDDSDDDFGGAGGAGGPDNGGDPAWGEGFSDAVKWNGWGYADTAFFVSPETGNIELSGRRYQHAFEAARVLPKLREFVEDQLGLDLADFDPGRQDMPAEADVAPPKGLPPSFARDCERADIEVRADVEARVRHCHGHTLQEVYALRFGELPQLPDAVAFITSHAQAEAVVAAAARHSVCLMPFGGGTSVSGALEVPEAERRPVVVVSTARMKRVLWVDRESMMACVEAGATGVDLEQRLRAQGVCTGHEPDSGEFSSLGGWVATRASGMKKNVYGNIEDIVVDARVVTPTGVLGKGCLAPRTSTGPDTVLEGAALGSEGTLGLVTEVVVKLQPVPQCVEYGSIAFPSFGAGVAAMREVAKQRVAPASIRLVDPVQFALGQAMKAAPESPLTSKMMDAAKKWFVLSVKGFVAEEMCAATLLFQGTPAEVKEQQRRVHAIGRQFGGFSAGAESGRRGYFLTYMIAYLRDYGLNYGFLAESFETSVPWSSVLSLCHGVKARIASAARERGVSRPPFVSCRVTQVYDTGACVYFYFGFVKRGLKDPVRVFTEVEAAARDEILAHGGSLSHHHGVGKHRKQWMAAAVGDTGIRVLRGVKATLDPDNVFANGNLL